MGRLRTFFSTATLLSQKFCLLVSILAIVLMMWFTARQQVLYLSHPLQVQGLAGRDVSTEVIADVFIRMDELAMRQHYLFIWTFNGLIFLSTLLFLKVSRVSPGK